MSALLAAAPHTQARSGQSHRIASMSSAFRVSFAPCSRAIRRPPEAAASPFVRTRSCSTSSGTRCGNKVSTPLGAAIGVCPNRSRNARDLPRSRYSKACMSAVSSPADQRRMESITMAVYNPLLEPMKPSLLSSRHRPSRMGSTASTAWQKASWASSNCPAFVVAAA